MAICLQWMWKRCTRVAVMTREGAPTQAIRTLGSWNVLLSLQQQKWEVLKRNGGIRPENWNKGSSFYHVMPCHRNGSFIEKLNFDNRPVCYECVRHIFGSEKWSPIPPATYAIIAYYVVWVEFISTWPEGTSGFLPHRKWTLPVLGYLLGRTSSTFKALLACGRKCVVAKTVHLRRSDTNFYFTKLIQLLLSKRVCPETGTTPFNNLHNIA